MEWLLPCTAISAAVPFPGCFVLPARKGWEGPTDEMPASCLHDQHNAHASAFLSLLSFAAVCGGKPHASAPGQRRRLPAIPSRYFCQGGLEDLQSQELGAGPHPFPPSSCLRMFLVPAVTLAPPERKCCRAVTQAEQAGLASGVGWAR